MPGDKKAALSGSPESIAAKKKKRERFTNQKVDINRVEQATTGASGLAHPKKYNMNNLATLFIKTETIKILLETLQKKVLKALN